MNTYKWNEMVSITVPDGLNGWRYSGSVMINGRKFTFPTGVETKLPKPVADIINRMIKEEEEAGNTGTGTTGATVQPDWNQNDPEAADYVKNRTHWTYVVDKEVANTSVTISSAGGYKRIKGFSGSQFVEGHEYTVTFNGTEYKCVAWTGEGSAVYIGNGDIYGGAGKGNGEPFCCDSYTDPASCYLNAQEAGTHTIIIYGGSVEVQTIDPKFIDEYDVIVQVGANGTPGSSNTKDDFTVIKGTSEAAYAKLEKGFNLKALLRCYYWYGDICIYHNVHAAIVRAENSSKLSMFFLSDAFFEPDASTTMPIGCQIVVSGSEVTYYYYRAKAV